MLSSKTNNIKRVIKDSKNGNNRAREFLYKEFFGFAMSICLRYAYSREAAEDLLNDSFIKVFEKIHLYKSSVPFKSWLRRIIINTAIDGYRKNKNTSENCLEIVEATSVQPEIEGISHLNVQDILMLFNELPEIYKVTFNLYEIEGYSHEEISDMLGIAVGTSRSNLTRAKQKIRVLYGKYFNDHKS